MADEPEWEVGVCSANVVAPEGVVVVADAGVVGVGLQVEGVEMELQVEAAGEWEEGRLV